MTSGNGGLLMKIAGGVITAAIVGLTGAVWTLNTDVAVAQNDIENQQKENQVLVDEVKDNGQKIIDLRIAIEKALTKLEEK